MIDLLIISYNGKDFTSQAIESALANTVQPRSIIVLDNNSTDGSVEYLSSKFKDIQIIANKENLSYGGGANLGIKFCNSDFVVISNNDVIFPPNFFSKLLEAIDLLDGKFGILGPLQIYPNGKPQFSFGSLHSVLSALLDVTFLHILFLILVRMFYKVFHYPRFLKVGYVDGAVICVNRKAFESIGGFDENFRLYSEDTDLCLRMKKKGYNVLVDMDNTVVHYRGQGKNDRIGVTPQRIEQFVNARVLYCQKNLSSLSAKLYFLLESIFYLELLVVNLIRRIFGKSNKDTIKFCLTSSKLFFIKFLGNKKFKQKSY